MNKNQSIYWKVKVTDLERQALKLLAEQEGLSTSEAMRLCVRETAKRAGLWPLGTPTGGHAAIEGNSATAAYFTLLQGDEEE